MESDQLKIPDKNQGFLIEFYSALVYLWSDLSPVVVALPRSRTDKSHAIAAGRDTGILSHLRTVGISDSFGGGDRACVRDTGDGHPRGFGDPEIGDIEGFVPVHIAGIEDAGRREVDGILRGICLRPSRGSGDIDSARTSARGRIIETGFERRARGSGSDGEVSGTIESA